MELKGKKFWDTIAPTFVNESTFSRKYVFVPQLIKILGNVKNKKIFEIGCGPGKNLMIFAQKGAICAGIDYSEDMISVARQEAERKNVYIDYSVVDALNLKSVTGTFDFVLIANFLIFLKGKTNVERVLKHAARLLSPTGKLVIGEPHPAFDYYMRTHLNENKFDYFTSGMSYQFSMDLPSGKYSSHAYRITLEDYARVLRASGFGIRNIYEPKPVAKAFTEQPETAKQKSHFPPYIFFECTKAQF
ncbi:MAG: class I SAM-dependent methyltransferase [Patescibacteria group bacterium]|jgi:2-polyprenyl-3-methyl-5-hydroxy-6-metoxy-1,4-benzoquinol methylase